jgi:hypothetical protein
MSTTVTVHSGVSRRGALADAVCRGLTLACSRQAAWCRPGSLAALAEQYLLGVRSVAHRSFRGTFRRGNRPAAQARSEREAARS